MKNKKLNKEKAIQCGIRCKSLKWMKWGSVPMCASLNTEHMHPTEAFTPSAAYVEKATEGDDMWSCIISSMVKGRDN